MTWFSRKPPDERQERSQAQMARGGLPLHAEERLRELKGRTGSFFTSSLSVNEFVLSASEKFRPLGQVMGSTVYHLGWQYNPMYVSGELVVWGQAQQEARRIAFGRLQQEAALLGAHGVIGVRLDRKTQEWGQNLLEFSAQGTAVAMEGQPPPAMPFLTALSAQEYWTLHRGGYRPVGVAFGACAFYQIASISTQYAQQYSGNVELSDYSRAVYVARHLAMEKLQDDARRLGAEGLVGVVVEPDVRTTEVEINGQSRRDLIVQFSALGTAIVHGNVTGHNIDFSLPLMG